MRSFLQKVLASYTVTQSMIDWAIDGGAVGTIELDPRVFLILTSTPEERKGIKQEAKDFKQYDDWGKAEQITIMPFLTFDFRSGQIQGHEGRHRAFAAMKDGAKTITVALKPRPKYSVGWDADLPDRFYGEFGGAPMSLKSFRNSYKKLDRVAKKYVA